MSEAMKIVVGLSGGVDSSVAALRLLEAGHEVHGLFMKNWEEDDEQGYCAALADLEDAGAVAGRLGIPLHTINFSYEYWQAVFETFGQEMPGSLMARLQETEHLANPFAEMETDD